MRNYTAIPAKPRKLMSEGAGDDNGISAAAIPVMTQQQDRGHSSFKSFRHIAELLQYDLRLVLSNKARCVLIRHLTLVETLIFYLLPCFLCSKWKFVHVFQEEGECPNLLIGEGRLPRGHAGPANAVFDLPE